jgi:hypothetical protein
MDNTLGPLLVFAGFAAGLMLPVVYRWLDKRTHRKQFQKDMQYLRERMKLAGKNHGS